MGWHNKPNRISPFVDYNKKVKAGKIKKNFKNQYTKAKLLGLPKPIISKETRQKLSIAGKNQTWSLERRKRHSTAMLLAVKNNPESYSSSNVSGRVKTFNYNGFKLKGNWELEVAKWLDEHDIKWTNEMKPFEYEWNNKIHLYFPDFYLIDYDKYIEVKGFERERDRCKWKVVNNLIILKKNEIQLIKNSVVSPQAYIL